MVGVQALLRAAMKANTVLLVLLAGVLLADSAPAQQPSLAGLVAPRLLVVSPCGGKAGATVEVTLSGQGFEDPERLLFSQAGIKAELLTAAPVPVPQDKNNKNRKGRPRPPVPQGAVKFKVAIPADTPLGIHDVRLVTKGGISNPRAFVVGDLTEIQEKEPNNDVEKAQRVELNTTIHGTISASTDVDYFRFAGDKGQRVVLSCLASSIDSRLPVALQLYDQEDRLLASNRDYQGHDALVDCTLPETGDYYVRVYDFAYTQGGPENFYRLTISTAPWIDAVYPPVVEPGKQAKLTVYGRNLPGGKRDPSAVVHGRVLEKVSVTVDVPKDAVARQRLHFSGHIPPKSSALDGFEYRIRNDSGSSNAVLLTYAQAPVVLDNEKNDSADTAQEVTLPCEIVGRIEKKRDRDWYAFHAKKGAVYSIEAYAERLGSPIDLYFMVRDARTKRVLVELDDNPDSIGRGQFFTRSLDPPRYRFAAPADGDYQLLVTSREAGVQAGPRDIYRVRITPEQPDFRLIVMPSSATSPEGCVLRRKGNQDYSVFVWRLDGWNGPIAVSVEGLPTGVTCRPLTIAGGLREASLVLQAEAEAPFWTGSIKVKGTATIGGQTVVREARPATITWPVPVPQFPTVSRLDRSLVLAVRDKAPFTLDVGLTKTVALHGSRVTIPVKVNRVSKDFKFPIFLLPVNFPAQQFRFIQLTPGKDATKLVLEIRPNIPPGVYTVVLRGRAQIGGGRRFQFGGQNVGIVQPAAPIMVTVLPQRLDDIAVGPLKLKVQPGGQAEVLVKVGRKFAFYTGEFKVELVTPPNRKGIHAEETSIPAGKDRTKLTVEVDPDVKPGTAVDVMVRISATVNNTTIKQESRLNVVVLK